MKATVKENIDKLIAAKITEPYQSVLIISDKSFDRLLAPATKCFYIDDVLVISQQTASVLLEVGNTLATDDDFLLSTDFEVRQLFETYLEIYT